MRSAVVILALLAAVSAVSSHQLADDPSHKLDPIGFLTHYGYYNPKVYSRASVGDAITQFQDFYGLAPTGVVDDATKTEMKKPRCGFPDVVDEGHGYYVTNGRWPRKHLTYRFLNSVRTLSGNVMREAIKRAFDLWSQVTPLTFQLKTSGRTDMTIGFHYGASGHRWPFPRGRGGILAHASFPTSGVICFDHDENWTSRMLTEVGTHEIGHALGLRHTRVRGSTMWPSYVSSYYSKIGDDDRKGIQSLYRKNGGGGPNPATQSPPSNCVDNNNSCDKWAKRVPSECKKNPRYMLRMCKKSCNVC